MKLGMPILYEYNSLIDNVVLAKTLGYDFIELNLNFDYCRGELENDQIINYLKESKLEFTIHFFDEFDAAIYDEVVDAYIEILKKYLEYDYLEYEKLDTIAENKKELTELEDLYNKCLDFDNPNVVKKKFIEYDKNFLTITKNFKDEEFLV